MGIHPVTLARMYAGITQKELGRRLNRAQSYIARLERFEYDLDSVKDDLYGATGLPLSFFEFDDKWIVPESSVSYRKRGGCPAVIRDRAFFYCTVAASRLEPMVAEHVRYPAVDVPCIPMELPPETLVAARKAGAMAARRVREDWGVGWGPIGDVIRLMESKGIRVFFIREPAESLDGFASWVGDKPYIFLNSFVEDPARLRYDVAHELGHIVMHKEITLDSDIDLCEAMAHGFAAEFLVPWETFCKEAPAIPDINHLGPLRRRWKVSMQALVKHMHTNGAISDSAYTNAFKRFAFLGYRRGPEPGWFVPDASVIHTKFLDVVMSKGLSVSNLADNRGISESLLAQFVPDSTAVTSV